MDLPVDADAVINQSTQYLVRLLVTEGGKKVSGWLVNLWRRKRTNDVDQVAESIELDRQQLVSADEPVREALSEALRRKWADNLYRLLRDDPEALHDLVELAQRLRGQDDTPAVSATNQVGINWGSGNQFMAGGDQTINQGRGRQ